MVLQYLSLETQTFHSGLACLTQPLYRYVRHNCMVFNLQIQNVGGFNNFCKMADLARMGEAFQTVSNATATCNSGSIRRLFTHKTWGWPCWHDGDIRGSSKCLGNVFVLSVKEVAPQHQNISEQNTENDMGYLREMKTFRPHAFLRVRLVVIMTLSLTVAREKIPMGNKLSHHQRYLCLRHHWHCVRRKKYIPIANRDKILKTMCKLTG